MPGYPYFENPFEVSSDEWHDRSQINLLIENVQLSIDGKEDTIKDYRTEINKDIEKNQYPNNWCIRVEKHIKRYQRQVMLLKAELSTLKRDNISDKEKLSVYWLLHHQLQEFDNV